MPRLNKQRSAARARTKFVQRGFTNGQFERKALRDNNEVSMSFLDSADAVLVDDNGDEITLAEYFSREKEILDDEPELLDEIENDIEETDIERINGQNKTWEREVIPRGDSERTFRRKRKNNSDLAAVATLPGQKSIFFVICNMKYK